MNAPIFPQVIYPIGDLPDGRYSVEVRARGFQYSRDLPELDFDLPELDFDDDEPDTIPDGRDTIPSPSAWEDDEALRPREIEQEPWYRRAIAWCRAA